MVELALAGRCALVTRPENQAEDLVSAVEALGGSAVRFPALRIAPLAATTVLENIRQLSDPDIAIFVSPNAVEFGLDYVGDARIAAIGPATAAAIEAAGRTVDIVSPSGYNSEHLLAEAALKNVAGSVVRIIRGQSGRELLADTLRSRGASVDFLAVYERGLPDYTGRQISAVENRLAAGEIDFTVVMSTETLRNLLQLLPAASHDHLVETLLVTPAERVIKVALELLPGIPTTLAQGPQVEDMVRAMLEHGSNAPGKIS